MEPLALLIRLSASRLPTAKPNIKKSTAKPKNRQVCRNGTWADLYSGIDAPEVHARDLAGMDAECVRV